MFCSYSERHRKLDDTHQTCEIAYLTDILASDERIVGNRLLNNRIPNVIGSYDYRLRKVIVTK